MAIRLSMADGDFEVRFSHFLTTKRESAPDVDAVVREIIAAVRARGDAALNEYTLKFDKADLGAIGRTVTRNDIEKAYAKADPATVEALKFARDRIKAHHQRQKPSDDRYVDPIGVELGTR